jgi:ketosteroid isomerase-like protein
VNTRGDANRAVVERLYALMNERRFDEMWELFAPDALWSGGSGPGRTVEEMRRIIIDPNPRFEDGGIGFVLHATTVEGDRVAAEAESRATLTNGRRYNNHYHMLFVFSDGLIQRVKEYNDTLHAQETFGDL